MISIVDSEKRIKEVLRRDEISEDPERLQK